MKITAGQLRKISNDYKYILMRRSDNVLVGFNTRAIFKGANNQWTDSSVLYGYSSNIPCNIAEYITYKMPYK